MDYARPFYCYVLRSWIIWVFTTWKKPGIFTRGFLFYLWKSEIFTEFYRYSGKLLKFKFKCCLFLKTLFLGLFFFFSITQNVENRLAINMAYTFVYIHVTFSRVSRFFTKKERRDDNGGRSAKDDTRQKKVNIVYWAFCVRSLTRSITLLVLLEILTILLILFN